MMATKTVAYRYCLSLLDCRNCSMSVQNTNITPKVWSRFQGTRKDGSVTKLRIQDFPWEQYKKEILDYFMEHFLDEEAIHEASGISKNEEAKTEYRELLHYAYEHNQSHICICCVDDSNIVNPEILGLSLMVVVNADSKVDDLNDYKPKTKELQNLFDIYSVIKDIKISGGYETYYTGRGISVRRDHRGLGIANEFVRLRKQICIDNNVQMSCAWMSAIGTQKAADKYKWETFQEISVKEYEGITGHPFNANTPVFRLMYTTKE